MKKIVPLILALFLIFSLCACQNAAETEVLKEQEQTQTQETKAPESLVDWVNYKTFNLKTDVPVKNVILMIGDGMGENIIKASEILKGEKLLMRGLDNQTYVKTDSLSGVTDSAAAGTAMSCGIKTANEYLGVDDNSQPVETICEFAMARKLKTGLVCTQILPHATPASMIVHNDSRGLYNNNFKQMVLAGVDVMFGGGKQYFTEKNEERAADAGYKYITEASALDTLKSGDKALGIFSPGVVDVKKEPRLDEMTEKALELLDNENGFFLMVEGSDIDSYEHKSKMNEAIEEMKRFEMAINTVLTFAQENPGTLVIITADHETGGVKLPENAKPQDINDSCFTSDGNHTGSNVLLFAGGARSDKFKSDTPIENTQISKLMREVITESYGNAPQNILTN